MRRLAWSTHLDVLRVEFGPGVVVVELDSMGSKPSLAGEKKIGVPQGRRRKIP
jgi:hypothetical protein